jgi:hypothetical protein
MEIFAAIAFPIFIFLLPLLVLLPVMPGMPAVDAWLLRVCFPFLSPFSAVLWLIVLHRLIARRRSRYFHQFLVFAATAILLYGLARLGIYRLG